MSDRYVDGDGITRLMRFPDPTATYPANDPLVSNVRARVYTERLVLDIDSGLRWRNLLAVENDPAFMRQRGHARLARKVRSALRRKDRRDGVA